MDNDIDKIATQANLVLQVNRSHLERMEAFLIDHYIDSNHSNSTSSPITSIEIVATMKSTASKSCSLIFLHATDVLAFINHMISRYKFVLHGLNKVYTMACERSIIKGDFTSIVTKHEGVSNETTNADDECMSHYLLRLLQKLQQGYNLQNSTKEAEESSLLSVPKSVVVKVDVFPSKLQHQVISNLTTLLDSYSIPESELDISPSNQTHSLSILQLVKSTTCTTNKKANNEKRKGDALFFIGLATIEQCSSALSQQSPDSGGTSSNNDICRAYYKLSEAFERYSHQCKDTTNNLFPLSKVESGSKRKDIGAKPIIAVDCGAAPGGWTKFLVEQTVCDEVYAIDPGEMDESVASLQNVHHLKMTAAKAIPKLRDIILAQRKNNDNTTACISLWVSDMCVHDIPSQVDTFLSAYSQGIFHPEGAMFVLTIKCNIGHGKERFDKLAEDQAKRLMMKDAYGVQIIHLFSNRIGERTIIGYIR